MSWCMYTFILQGLIVIMDCVFPIIKGENWYVEENCYGCRSNDLHLISELVDNQCFILDQITQYVEC